MVLIILVHPIDTFLRVCYHLTRSATCFGTGFETHVGRRLSKRVFVASSARSRRGHPVRSTFLKIGVALGGGGVKGMAHIGVLRVLESAKIPVQVVTGTSAGAIVGALYAAGESPDEIEQLARERSIAHWFARDKSRMGLFSTDGICRLIEFALGQNVLIENLPRTFACVAVDLDSGEEVVFKSGPLAEAVCASCAFPGIFAPVRIGDRFLFDGGVTNPVPFDVARRLGANRVIACDLGAQEPFFTENAIGSFRHSNLLWNVFHRVSNQRIFKVVERSQRIMAQKLREYKMAGYPPDLMIYPRVEKVGLLDFDLSLECISAGEEAAREVLPQIERLMDSNISIGAWNPSRRKQLVRRLVKRRVDDF